MPDRLDETRAAPSPWKAGALCRCPYCGQGRLYVRFITVAEKCEACGRPFENAEQGDGAAVFVIFILGFLILGSAVIVDLAFSPPLWLHALIWPPAILLGTVGLLRPVKALFIALQFRHDAGEGRIADNAKSGDGDPED